MPLGNPIRKQNESRMVSVLATEGQTVFTVQGGYIINHISVFRNGVRLSNSEDFTAGDGSTVTLNNAANIDDRIEFHIFDRFTVQNAIVSAASTQTIQGDLVVNGKLFSSLDVPSINTGIVTATNLNITGISTFGNVDFSNLDISGITTTGSLISNGAVGIGTTGARGATLEIQDIGGTGPCLLLAGATGTEGDIVVPDGQQISLGHWNNVDTFTERFRIDSSGKVGLGTNNPTGSLSIASGAFQTTTPTATGDDIVISGDQSVGIQFLTLAANTSNNNIYFGDTSDPDIGMIRYSHASNSLQFQTNAAEAMRIDAAGEVGIGTDNPESVLDVRNYKNGAQTKIMLYNTDNDNTSTQTAGMFMSPDSRAFAYAGLSVKKEVADMSSNAGRDVSLVLNVTENNSQVEAVHITSAGNVGIHTDNPTRKFVVQDSTDTFVSVKADIADDVGIIFGDTSDDQRGQVRYTNSNDALQFWTAGTERVRIRSWGDVNLTQNLNVAGISTFTGLGDFNNGINVLSAVTISDSIVHDGDSNTKIRFPAADTFTVETAGSERMRIASDGKMGLGTNNPGSELHVSALGASDEPTIKISSENSSIFLRTAGSSGSFPTGGAGNDGELVYIGGDFRFGIGTASKNLIFFNGSGYTERLRIKSDGGVGINTVGARGATLEVQDIGTTGPTLLLAGGTTTEGDITVPDGQQISLGHWNNVDTFTERVRISSDGEVQINDAAAGQTVLSCEGLYANSGNVDIATFARQGNAVKSAIRYADASTSMMVGSTTGHHFGIMTGGTERVRVTSGGHVQIISGNLEFSDGAGIDFSNVPASGASGTNVSTDGNKFDDYEEGDWDPVLNFSGGTSGITYSARDGAYTKIGRQVTVNFMVELSSKGSSNGTARISGLPYNVTDLISSTVIEASGISAYWNNFDPDMYFMGYTAESGNYLTIRSQPETGATDVVNSLNDANFADSSTFRGTVTYFTTT